MTPDRKVYLGDSVYASFDGYAVILTTENGYLDDPRNRIALEPFVLHAMNNYVHGLTNEREVSDESQC